jgi:hypothetical protein
LTLALAGAPDTLALDTALPGSSTDIPAPLRTPLSLRARRTR